MILRFKIKRVDFVASAKSLRMAMTKRGPYFLHLIFEPGRLIIESEWGGVVLDGDIGFELRAKVRFSDFEGMVKQHRFDKLETEWLSGLVDVELEEVCFERGGMDAVFEP